MQTFIDNKINWQYVADRRMELLRKAGKRMDDLEATIRDRDRELKEVSFHSRATIENRERSLHRVDLKIDALINRNAILHETIDTMNDRITNKSDHIIALVLRIANLKEDHRDVIATFNDAMAGAQDRVKDLNRELAKVKK